VVFAGPRDGQLVALTFHGSGDPAVVVRLLELLDDRGRVPVSVFAVGAWLEANPAMAERFLAGGHELDNHTSTHPVLGRVPRATVAEEIRGCRRTLMRLTGSGGRYFRPSGMTVPTQLVLAEAGKSGYPVVVSFDVDSHDYADPGPDAIVARVTAGMRPGSIVSLHTGHAGTISALPRVLAALDARGLRPVPLHRLLAGA
jgi:peptidoglycan/xylan/chitin deacetylase (PgdA/CDA1 family)